MDLILSELLQNSLLELFNFLWREHIGLGDEWNKVDPRLERFHEFDVDRAQPVSTRVDKVKAAMNPIVHNMAPV